MVQVGGIFVRIFNQSPSLPSSPPDFLSNLLSTILDPDFSDKFSVLIEAIYNIFSLQPSLIGQMGNDDQVNLQSVVSLILETLNTRSSWDDLRLLKHLIMTLRLLANSKTSPLLNLTADQVVTPLIKVPSPSPISIFYYLISSISFLLINICPINTINWAGE